MTKTSAVWKYVKDGKCQVTENGKICNNSVDQKKSENVWRHFKTCHKEFHDKLKEKESPAESNQLSMNTFVNVKAGPLKDLALLFATSTAPMSMLNNDRFKVKLNLIMNKKFLEICRTH
jgi:hypothetical protein